MGGKTVIHWTAVWREKYIFAIHVPVILPNIQAERYFDTYFLEWFWGKWFSSELPTLMLKIINNLGKEGAYWSTLIRWEPMWHVGVVIHLLWNEKYNWIRCPVNIRAHSTFVSSQNECHLKLSLINVRVLSNLLIVYSTCTCTHYRKINVQLSPWGLCGCAMRL